MLMSLVTGAATSSERECRRATLLANVLWDDLAQLQASTQALKDAINEKLGSTEPMPGWDANYDVGRRR